MTKAKEELKNIFQELLKKMKLLYKNINKSYLIIFAIAIIIFLPYFSHNFSYGCDSIFHISNIYSMDEYISLNELSILPSKINPVMANNMGYGTGIFYPQLPYYLTMCIHIILKQLGLSLITSIKIYEFLIVFLSGVFMHKFMHKTFEDRKVALLSSIIYVCTPYFITNIFERTAYAETTIFLFIPIIMLSINYILEKNYKQFLIYFVIGYVGMILSHLVMTVFFTIILGIVLLINIKKFLEKKTMLNFLLGTILVIGITSPFILPMLEHKINGNYVVFQDGAMYEINTMNRNRLTLTDKRVVNIGLFLSLITMITIAISILYKKQNLNKYNDKQKIMFWKIVIFTILSFLIGSTIINWEKIPKILWNIQFPWRVCTFIAFGTSVISGFIINLFKEKGNKLFFILITIICLADINRTMKNSIIQPMEIKEISYESISTVDGITMGFQEEYLPIKAKNNIEYLENRKQEITVKYGNAKTEITKNKTPYLEFEIDTNNAKVEIPRLFYYGYEIKLEDKNGKIEKIDYYENDKGFIEFEINKSGIVAVDYKGTTLNKIANVISIIAICLFLVYIIKSRREIFS